MAFLSPYSVTMMKVMMTTRHRKRSEYVVPIEESTHSLTGLPQSKVKVKVSAVMISMMNICENL